MSPQINFTTVAGGSWYNIGDVIPVPDWNLSFYVWHLLTARTEAITIAGESILFVDWFVDGEFYTRCTVSNASDITGHDVYGQELPVTLKIINDSRWFWAAIWNKGLTDAEISYLYSGIPREDWCRFDLTSNRGEYVSAEELVHWWRPGDGNIGNDEITPGVQLIDVDVNDWNIVNDFPGFFYAV